MSFLILSETTGKINLAAISWASFVFNAIAVAVLIAALFPPFLDTKRSKKTFGISAGFFKNYVKANGAMILNSVFTVVSTIIYVNYGKEQGQQGQQGQWDSSEIARVALFGGVFMCINCLSIYMNSFILRTKLANAKAAEEMGISEQEYYEKYLAKNVQQ